MSEPLRSLRSACRDSRDRLACTYEAVRFAENAGLHGRGALELGICVAELLSNTVHHGGGLGTLTLRLLPGSPRIIEVEVEDDGPGIDRPDLALRDGYSRGAYRVQGAPCAAGPGQGVGLPAVRRFADALEIRNKPGGGTRVIVRKSLAALG